MISKKKLEQEKNLTAYLFNKHFEEIQYMVKEVKKKMVKDGVNNALFSMIGTAIQIGYESKEEESEKN